MPVKCKANRITTRCSHCFHKPYISHGVEGGVHLDPRIEIMGAKTERNKNMAEDDEVG